MAKDRYIADAERDVLTWCSKILLNVFAQDVLIIGKRMGQKSCM